MINHDDSLYVKVVDRITTGGPVSFVSFMEMALYEPELGYYVSGKEKWGKEGDYITTLDLSPVFARTVARQLLEMWRFLDRPEQFHIVEAGAGRGWLTKEVLRALKELDPSITGALQVHLVEKNTNYHSQWELWKDEGLCFDTLRWHADIADIKAPIKGVIYSNELFDAMPFHRLVRRGAKLKEIYTALKPDGSGFMDIEGELSSPALSEYFDGLDVELAEGQTTEVNLNLAEWIKTAASKLDEGFIITVDYGMPAWRLYEKGRSGTLMCHYRHTLNDDPYQNLGRQDITAHLDFTSLMKAGERAGLETLGYTTQRCFMMGLDVVEDLIEFKEDIAEDSAAICYNQGIKELIMPGGIGDTMKVMVQYKPPAPWQLPAAGQSTCGAKETVLINSAVRRAPPAKVQTGKSAIINLKGFSFKDMVATLR